MILPQFSRITSGQRRVRRSAPPAQPACDSDLQQFYEEWFAPLVRRARWHHNLSAEDARDIVQDAFILAIGRLDGTKNPKLWLRRVVDNLALNLIRKTRRRKHLLRQWVPTEREPQGNE